MLRIRRPLSPCHRTTHVDGPKSMAGEPLSDHIHYLEPEGYTLSGAFQDDPRAVRRDPVRLGRAIRLP